MSNAGLLVAYFAVGALIRVNGVIRWIERVTKCGRRGWIVVLYEPN